MDLVKTSIETPHMSPMRRRGNRLTTNINSPLYINQNPRKNQNEIFIISL